MAATTTVDLFVVMAGAHGLVPWDELAAIFAISGLVGHLLRPGRGLQVDILFARGNWAVMGTAVIPNIVVDFYNRGMSVTMLARAYGLNACTLRAFLGKSGVIKRTRSEQRRVINGWYTRAQRAKKAWPPGRRRRGARHPEAALVAKALARQKIGAMTPKEQAWHDIFVGAGLQPVPQLAVSRYSVDLAFPDAMVAVEVTGNWGRSAAKNKAHHAVKQKALEGLGWTVFWVVTSQQGTRKERELLEFIKQRLRDRAA